MAWSADNTCIARAVVIDPTGPHYFSPKATSKDANKATNEENKATNEENKATNEESKATNEESR